MAVEEGGEGLVRIHHIKGGQRRTTSLDRCIFPSHDMHVTYITIKVLKKSIPFLYKRVAYDHYRKLQERQGHIMFIDYVKYVLNIFSI